MTISDLHGRTCWKNFGDINSLLVNSNTPEYDKYIFIGDYVDSFTVSNDVIKENLIEIISFKKMYPDNVILLWGNHDVEYLINKPWLPIPKGLVTGFRPEMHYDLYEIFNENKELFQISYQIQNYIWTHAGIHDGYYKFILLSKLKKNISEDELKNKNVADILNFCFDIKFPNIFDCGFYRGGRSRIGGPLWCDFLELYKKPLSGYHHIVGHSFRKEIKTYTYYKDKDTSTTFIDCLTDKKEDFLTTILN